MCNFLHFNATVNFCVHFCVKCKWMDCIQLLYFHFSKTLRTGLWFRDILMVTKNFLRVQEKFSSFFLESEMCVFLAASYTQFVLSHLRLRVSELPGLVNMA